MRKSAEIENVRMFSMISSELLILKSEISEFIRISVMTVIAKMPANVLIKKISLKRSKTRIINVGRTNVRNNILSS